MAFKWTCPFCNRDTTITEYDSVTTQSYLNIDTVMGTKMLEVYWIVCPNEDCNKYELQTALYHTNINNLGQALPTGTPLLVSQLVPQSAAKVFPDYIPLAIRQDYEESCSIVLLSAKASATLSRRCLQGMIRDFYGISKRTLALEIDAIKDKVDPLTWKSIEAIRKVGNIGAHMEKDIDIIIEVEPDEAKLLIQLIELLMKEWYIHRHERELQLNEIIKLSDDKTEAQKSAIPAS